MRVLRPDPTRADKHRVSASKDRLLVGLALGATAAALPSLLLQTSRGDKVYLDAKVHFFCVGITALAVTIAAVALTIVGARRRDGRTVLLATSFSVMAALLALHGLATPNVIVGINGVVAFTGGATLPVGGAILALTALPAVRRPNAVGPLLVAQGVLLGLILGLGISALLIPELVPAVPKPNSQEALAALAAGLLFFLVLAFRALRTHVLTRRWEDLVVAVGVAWLATALVPALTQSYWDLGWWLGHGFELAGVVLIAVPVWLDLRHAHPSRPLVGDLRGSELVASEERFLGAQVRALMQRLAEKDSYTEEHTRRVALRAVQVGESLGYPATRLRDLAIGGLLHDIGKLSVPDAILAKPGALDEMERRVIAKHPVWGVRLLGELGGFSEAVHGLVRDHHERLDGSGYPSGLREDELDLGARILAVCDVYDALISPRVYRGPWSHAEALQHLREHAGTCFDPRCVDALARVLESEHARSLPAAAPMATPVPAPSG
jgi:HD-GYP domain-containing protein (c-di-GMP phosphodiesterase class II)